jgi:hypothetical protein
MNNAICNEQRHDLICILFADCNRGPESIEDAAIGKSVRKILECHICKENLVAPVYSCSEGHYICGLCFPTLDGDKVIHCYCTKAITRFPGLDRTIELVHKQAKCRYSEEGCPFKDNASSIINHVKVCTFRYV